jgi:hypothetical protein
MAETKYGKHLIKAEIMAKEGEAPVLRFSAAEYGVNASWVLLPVTNLKPSAEDLPTHKHDFHQFITWFGADLSNIGDFQAEMFTCLGEEQERHIVNTPTIQNLPPGTPHCPGGWLRVDKPVYHLDIFLAPEWAKKDVTILDVPNRQTEGTKYSKHLMKAPIAPARHGPPVPALNFSATEYGVDMGWIIVPVLEPRLFMDKPHTHDFHQFFCFLGSNPHNIGELDAEVEVYLGEEGEKHVITTPTILHIPPGLIHCPMEYKRVGKPVLHLDIYFASQYDRKETSR